MKEFDLLLFDIQDVGLRFYTYYVSMARLMDACAEHGKKMIVLDRPNPNGFYVDGPLLDMKHKSGVGWLPIPVAHGMTLGELALMIDGEKWLPGGGCVTSPWCLAKLHAPNTLRTPHSSLAQPAYHPVDLPLPFHLSV